MNILITGVGGPTPRSIARSIKASKKFKDSKLFGTDINPYAYGLYESDLYEKTFLVPRANDAGYRKAIEKIVKEFEIDAAIVMPEFEVMVWSKWKQLGEGLPVKALLPEHAVAKLLVDKSLMTEILAPLDLAPESVTIAPEHIDYSLIEDKLGYPFWIRATSGSSGLGSLKVESRADLQTWITINKHVSAFLASTFLSGRNLACKLLYKDGELLRAASAERVDYIMAKVAPSGITGNTSYGRLLNEPGLVSIADRAMQQVFKHTNTVPNGFYTVDFKEDTEGKPYITEINVRMVAFNYLFALGGANFTEDILSLLLDADTFDTTYRMYEFEPDLIFLRDVDANPRLMRESEILHAPNS